VVFLLDTNTGKYGVVLDNETMRSVPGALVPIGIDGVKTLGGYFYFMNTFAGALVRVKVDCETRKAASSFDIAAKILSITDFFPLAKDGTAFIGGSFSNVVVEISPQCVANVIARNLNSSNVAGATSTTLGKTREDRGTLYVSITGGYGFPVNGTFIERGKVVRVQV
jgi:hypothetical protein